MDYYVYILTNKANNVLYCGITQNIERRTEEHTLKIKENGFAERYNCTKLVYVECTNDVTVAIKREKQIKKMKRDKKIKLIESFNPEWKDLFFVSLREREMWNGSSRRNKVAPQDDNKKTNCSSR